ncbi:UvrD-helicase domain-containing protein [Phenylobacterium koreense]|uniref:DNA helicase IV n=1 Tax=Phenylobacterium koreense TaxID=266125 RepID=A0ABV2EM84_9CAUL
MVSTVVVASAGSGKTTHLIDQAAHVKAGRVLITTYTNENVDNIRDCVVARFGYVPENIDIESWYSTLLRHGVRPYQNLLSNVGVTQTIAFIQVPQALRFVPKADVNRYFFTRNGDIYRDRVSDFVCLVDDKTGGKLIQRLEAIYSHILIDELQDMAGSDLDLLERLFKSKITMVAVADPRQGTYTTNNSIKHKKAARSGIVTWLSAMEKAGLITQEERAESWRCNQVICDFADALYPHLPRTTSRNATRTPHDGVFHISAADVPSYVAEFNPVVLRWNKNSDTLGLPATNFGVVKGRSFDRVLIFPTEPMRKYIKEPNPEMSLDRAKFYVAVTRARYSVAFVV